MRMVRRPWSISFSVSRAFAAQLVKGVLKFLGEGVKQEGLLSLERLPNQRLQLEWPTDP